MNKLNFRVLSEQQVMDNIIPALERIGGISLINNFLRQKRRGAPMLDLRNLVLNNFAYTSFNNERVDDLSMVLQYINHLSYLASQGIKLSTNSL